LYSFPKDLKITEDVIQDCYNKLQQSGLDELQAEILCQQKPFLLRTIKSAANKAHEECMNELKYETWNCSIDIKNYATNFLREG
jgi:hypothetical protein